VSTEADAIGQLTAIASQFNAHLVSIDGVARAVFDVVVQHTDGKHIGYALKIVASGVQVSAMEVVPTELPAYCPERHINYDGTFCLNWKEDVALEVRDSASAERWWNHLVNFLRTQARAANKKRWPGRAWAHGDAARHQRAAEAAAARLGKDFSEDLERDRLRVERVKQSANEHGSVIRLLRNEQVSYAALEHPLRVINKRQPCICKRGNIKRHRRLRNCETHAIDAANLVAALLNWKLKEEEFWAQARAKGRPCCGTIKDCPLQAAGAT